MEKYFAHFVNESFKSMVHKNSKFCWFKKDEDFMRIMS